MNFYNIYRLSHLKELEENKLVFRLRNKTSLFDEDLLGDPNVIYTSDDPMNPVYIYNNAGNISDWKTLDTLYKNAKVVDIYEINPSKFKKYELNSKFTQDATDRHKSVRDKLVKQGYEGHIKNDALGGILTLEYGLYNKKQKPIDSYKIEQLSDFIKSGYKKYLTDKNIEKIKEMVKKDEEHKNYLISKKNKEKKNYTIQEEDEDQKILKEKEKIISEFGFWLRYPNGISPNISETADMIISNAKHKYGSLEECEKEFKAIWSASNTIVKKLKSQGKEFKSWDIIGRTTLDYIPYPRYGKDDEITQYDRVLISCFNRIRKYYINRDKENRTPKLFEHKSFSYILNSCCKNS
jgi:hypothetical protein